MLYKRNEFLYRWINSYAGGTECYMEGFNFCTDGTIHFSWVEQNIIQKVEQIFIYETIYFCAVEQSICIQVEQFSLIDKRKKKEMQ